MEKVFIISSFKDDIKIESIAASNEYRALIKWCTYNKYNFSSLLITKEDIIEALYVEHKVRICIKPLRELI